MIVQCFESGSITILNSSNADLRVGVWRARQISIDFYFWTKSCTFQKFVVPLQSKLINNTL